MPVITYNTSLAAGASVNIMQNSIYEILPFNALLEFGILGSATGLTCQVSTGSNIILESGSPVGVTRFAALTLPVYPDDFHLNDVAGRAERVKVLFNNPTGGALTPLASIRITPL